MRVCANVDEALFVTRFAKINLISTNTEIHFLFVDESHTHALSKDTTHLRLDDLTRSAFTGGFFRCCQTTRVHFMACVAPEGH